MNKLITLGVLIPLLFLVAPKAYADSKHCNRDGWPACYDLGHYKGAVDASFDYNNNRGYDSSCPSGHSDNFCAGYSDGYSNWWHQVDQKNTGIQQGQSSNVNIKGNDNRVTVNQGQSVQGGSDTSRGVAAATYQLVIYYARSSNNLFTTSNSPTRSKKFDGRTILITLGPYEEIERNEKRMNLRELIGINRQSRIRTNREYRNEIAQRELEE